MTTTTKRKPGPRRHVKPQPVPPPTVATPTREIPPPAHNWRDDLRPARFSNQPTPRGPAVEPLYPKSRAAPPVPEASEPKPAIPGVRVVLPGDFDWNGRDWNGRTVAATFAGVPNLSAQVQARVAELKVAFLEKLAGTLGATPEGVTRARLREQEATASAKLRELQAVARSLREDIANGGDGAEVAALSKRLTEAESEARARESVLATIKAKLTAASRSYGELVRRELPLMVEAELVQIADASDKAASALWDSIADRLVGIRVLADYAVCVPGRFDETSALSRVLR